MKRLLVIAGSVVAACAVHAQGYLNFANGAEGVNAPIRDAAGVLITGGNNYVADLFWSIGSSAPESSLTPAGFNAGFSSSLPGYFLGGTQPLPGTTSGEVVSAEVRVWNTVINGVSGATYNMASTSPGGEWGKSIELNLTMGGGGGAPPGNLIGLTPFTLTLNPVPEPSISALIGLGACLLRFVSSRRTADAYRS